MDDDIWGQEYVIVTERLEGQNTPYDLDTQVEFDICKDLLPVREIIWTKGERMN